MKRTIACLLVLMSVLALCSCSKKPLEGLSDRAIKYGTAALETADDYLAGSITEEEAVKKLALPELMLESCSGVSVVVASEVSLLKVAIQNKRSGTGTRADIKTCRDKLAEYLGK